jgi:hypothetical protein
MTIPIPDLRVLCKIQLLSYCMQDVTFECLLSTLTRYGYLKTVAESAGHAFTSATHDLGIDGPTTSNPSCPPHSYTLLCMASGPGCSL